MRHDWGHGLTIEEELYARIIGWEVLRYIREYEPQLALSEAMEYDVIALVKGIRDILNNEFYDSDEYCLNSIKELVEVYNSFGISINRYDDSEQ